MVEKLLRVAGNLTFMTLLVAIMLLPLSFMGIISISPENDVLSSTSKQPAVSDGDTEEEVEGIMDIRETSASTQSEYSRYRAH